MKKRLQGLIAGVLICAILTSGMVFAKNIKEAIDAVYMNVKLVIDGEEITPKDVNGNIVEPFIYNGTTYLPVRAIGEAFKKDVHWDGETATVYVGDIVKPAKEVYLYDKPYLECTVAAEFLSGKKGDTLKYAEEQVRNVKNFIGFDLNLDNAQETSTGVYCYKNSATYPLNGIAKKVKGTLIAPVYYLSMRDLVGEYKVNFYNESGKLLYTSPILNKSVSPIDFEFETGKSLKLTVEFVASSNLNRSGYFYCLIENFAIVTTDY